MKILFITNHLAGTDGWSRYSNDILQAITKMGHDVMLLTESKDRSALREPLFYLTNPIKAFWLSRIINKQISDFNPDIIHFLVEPYSNSVGFLNLRKSKYKNIKLFLYAQLGK